MNDGQPMTDIALALGSNVGDLKANLRAARDALAAIITITQTSSLYANPPAYVTDQPDFINAALISQTALSPEELLEAVKAIETAVGREPTFRYGPRVIDIDIIFYGDQQINTPDLVIPHLLMHERAFVLLPLAEIAPTWVHPGFGWPISELLDSVTVDQTMKRLDEKL